MFLEEHYKTFFGNVTCGSSLFVIQTERQNNKLVANQSTLNNIYKSKFLPVMTLKLVTNYSIVRLNGTITVGK